FLKDDGTWAVAAGKSIATGSYVGDNTDNRQISVGFKCSLVIALYTWDFCAVIIPGKASSFNSVLTGGTDLHATDGFIVFETADIMNLTGVTYYYWAISE
ncbi:unnamed protein product, partial [marine sediment metagenome]